MAVVFSSDHRQLDLRSSSAPALISLHLRESLEACSSSIASEECIQSDQVVAPVISLIHSLVEPPTSDLEETLSGIECSEIALNEIYRYLSSPDSNRMVVEALSLELPKLVIKFAPVRLAVTPRLTVVVAGKSVGKIRRRRERESQKKDREGGRVRLERGRGKNGKRETERDKLLLTFTIILIYYRGLLFIIEEV
ncbi:hypothetical protein KSP39_PZI011468 [Platanthera zijinensis]|uniref:Uncharacterized protein n=1 Tax=Platanthera zijinensis TaxID=2320716 RepID=A0AAP0G5R0_9ASPA